MVSFKSFNTSKIGGFFWTKIFFPRVTRFLKKMPIWRQQPSGSVLARFDFLLWIKVVGVEMGVFALRDSFRTDNVSLPERYLFASKLSGTLLSFSAAMN